MIEDRQVPYSLDSEEAVLGSMLIDTDVSVDLLPSDFYRDKNQWVYEAILKVKERGGNVDQITVADALGTRLEDVGGKDYLGNLIHVVPTSVHIQYYAKIVKDKAFLRNLAITGERISDIAFEVSNPNDALERATQQMNLLGMTVNTELKPIDWQNAKEDDYHKMNMTFDLHKYVKLFAGIVIVAGVFGRGKTAFFYDMIFRNLSDDRPQYLFSNDMRAKEMHDRFIARSDNGRLKLPTDDQLKTYDWSDNFHKVIVKDGINYIDYLKIFKDYERTAEKICEINRVTGDGLTFIGLQKNPEHEVGYGGILTASEPQLYINLDKPKPDWEVAGWTGQMSIQKARGRIHDNFDPCSIKAHYCIHTNGMFTMSPSSFLGSKEYQQLLEG